MQGPDKFNPKAATQLGCSPKIHFKLLTAGQSVTLEDGTVVTTQMVTEKAPPAEALELVFLPDLDYVESFLSNNVNFHEQI